MVNFLLKVSGKFSINFFACKEIAIGAEGLGFNFRVGQSRNSVAMAVMFLRSCVSYALSLGDDSCHSLHASAY